MRYPDRKRTRQTFIVTTKEWQGKTQNGYVLTCRVKGGTGLLAVWGTGGQHAGHTRTLEEALRPGKPVTVECDWIAPDQYETDTFDHRYWVSQNDHFTVVQV